MSYTIDILKVGQADVHGPEVYWMSKWFDWETLFFYMLVVRGEGKTVVINTGPPEDVSEISRVWVQYIGDERGALKVAPEERPARALARLGVDPAEVDYVIISPLQAYSISNVQLFPNATICLSRRGWVDFHAPKFSNQQTTSRKASIPDDVLHYLVIDAWSRVRLLEDEEQILPGLRTFWVGAHGAASLAICIDTAKGTVIYSDCAFKYPNIEESRLLGIAMSLDDCQAAYARIRKEADIFIPGFDPDVLSRFPGGRLA